MGAKEVIVVHVVDVIPEDIVTIDVLEKNARERLESLIADLKKNGKLRQIVSIGAPSKEIAAEAICPSFEIVEQAKCEMVDLIVIPTKGKNILREMLIGSTARNVARTSKVPVLLLNYKWDRKKKRPKKEIECNRLFDKPLIALDLSTCSDAIIGRIKKFEEKVKEGVLYHVVDYGSPEETEENVSEAKRQLEKYEKKLSFSVKKRVDSGEASESILDVAEDEDATLIVAGKLGRGMVKEILIGSTANAIMRRSKIPVFLISC
jgi:nucleotide-binding universal stress UspA family protein